MNRLFLIKETINICYKSDGTTTKFRAQSGKLISYKYKYKTYIHFYARYIYI